MAILDACGNPFNLDAPGGSLTLDCRKALYTGLWCSLNAYQGGIERDDSPWGTQAGIGLYAYGGAVQGIQPFGAQNPTWRRYRGFPSFLIPSGAPKPAYARLTGFAVCYQPPPSFNMLIYANPTASFPAPALGDWANCATGTLLATVSSDFPYVDVLIDGSLLPNPGEFFGLGVLAQNDRDNIKPSGSGYEYFDWAANGYMNLTLLLFYTGLGTPVLPAPVLTSISPASGISTGGTPVTLIGTGFTGVTNVPFGIADATSVVVVSDTEITCVTPATYAAPVYLGNVPQVAVNRPLSPTSNVLNFSHTYAAPTLTSASPSGGVPTGGTAVTLTGTGFLAGATVSFGGVAATSVVVVSATQITCVDPAHAVGSVNVTVRNPDSQVSNAVSFTYAVANPTVTGVSPNNGYGYGGSMAGLITITGTGFEVGATVTFGDTGVTSGVKSATSVTVVSSTQITCYSPSHWAGAVTVTVNNPDGGTGSRAAAYTFNAIVINRNTLSNGMIRNAQNPWGTSTGYYTFSSLGVENRTVATPAGTFWRTRSLGQWTIPVLPSQPASILMSAFSSSGSTPYNVRLRVSNLIPPWITADWASVPGGAQIGTDGLVVIGSATELGGLFTLPLGGAPIVITFSASTDEDNIPATAVGSVSCGGSTSPTLTLNWN